MMGQTLDSRGLEPLNQIPLLGFVNGIAIGPKARFCVVAVGQEPRLGRWNRIAKAKNRFGIVRLRSDEDTADSDDELDENEPDEKEPSIEGADESDSDDSASQD
jgi:hypothetical protein